MAFGGCTRDTKRYARVFADEGYDAVCLGFCMSGSGKSSGSSLGMSVLTEKADLLNVPDYIKPLDFVNKKGPPFVPCGPDKSMIQYADISQMG